MAASHRGGRCRITGKAIRLPAVALDPAVWLQPITDGNHCPHHPYYQGRRHDGRRTDQLRAATRINHA